MARKKLEDQAGVYKRVNKDTGAVTYEKRFSVDGKRYSVYGKNAAELKAKEEEKRRIIEGGISADVSRMSLDMYYERWFASRLQEVKKGNLKEATMCQYNYMYNKHIRSKIGMMKIQKISKCNIEAMLNSLDSPNTYNRILKAIKKILNDAVKDEIITSNPARLITSHKVSASDERTYIHRALTKAEQSAFMDAMKGDFFYEFMAFLLCTGVRGGEAAALQWSDIDWKNHTIHIQRTRTKLLIGDGYGKPKTAKGDRHIPMTAAVEAILKTQRQKNNDLFGNVMSIDSKIFTTTGGRMIRGREICTCIDLAIERAAENGVDIVRFTPHALRDTYATRCIEAGMNPKTLQIYLGHATLAMTMDRYVGVTEDTMKAEMVDVFAI